MQWLYIHGSKIYWSIILYQSSWFEYQSVRQSDFKEGCCTTNKKNKECRPTQIEIKDNQKKRNHATKTKEFRSLSTQLRVRSTEPNSDGTNIQQQHLFYTNKDPKNYPFIDVGTSIPLVTNKNVKTIVLVSLLLLNSLFFQCYCIHL